MTRLQSLFRGAQDARFQEARPIGRSCRFSAFVATLFACTLGAGFVFRRTCGTGMGSIEANMQSVTGRVLSSSSEAVACKRPKEWCAGTKEYIYTTRDCDGDGEPDPFCCKPGANSSTSTCGCLQSTSNCHDTWPASCPVLETSFDLKVLPVKGRQIPVESGVDGIMMYKYVAIGDAVSTGANLFSIVDSKDTVHEIKAPCAGRVVDVAKVYPGDAVSEVTRLAVVDSMALVLPRLTGPGVVTTATGYKGYAIFKSWAPATKMGWWVPKGSAICTMETASGSELSINAASSGMVNNMQNLKYGDEVDTGSDLVKLLSPTDGGEIPLAPRQKIMQSLSNGKLMEWRVNIGDLVRKGDPVLKFAANGQTTTAKWDGPPGMVVAKGNFTTGDIFAADVDLISVQGHLPRLPVGEKTIVVKAPTYTWLKFAGYQVKYMDQVQDGEIVATGTPVQSGTMGQPVPILFRAEKNKKNSTYIRAMQDIQPGEIVGAGDDLCVVGPQPTSFNWWLLLGCLAICCLLLCFVVFCCNKKKEEQKPEPVEPVPEVEEPLIAPEPVVVEVNPVVEDNYVPPGVPIYFDRVPYYCQYKPLGIKFYEEMPIRIEQFIFNSYGKTLGLRQGMRLTRVQDEDLEGCTHISHAEEILHRALEPLPWWPLHVDFRTQGGEIVGFDFLQHPLGIEFTRNLPIKIAKFKKHSYAEEMGVKIGWEIVQIADEDEQVFRDSHDAFKLVNDHLHEGLNHLPKREGQESRHSWFGHR